MRVPIPMVILSCLFVVFGVWWAGTRRHDFLTPPDGIQQSVVLKNTDDSAPPEKSANQPQEEPPQLAEYRNEAASDPAQLLEVARQLETQGKLQRSLLAWERILDTAPPDEARTAEALLAIKRLRPALPEWNTDPARTIPITLHAGTAKSTAETLTPVLEEIVRQLERASSGILKITASVTAGKDIPITRGPAPIALWFSGSDMDARSTEVRAFTVRPEDAMQDKMLENLHRLVRSHLSRSASLNVPEAGIADEHPLDTVNSRITRLGWMELGTRLNKTLE